MPGVMTPFNEIARRLDSYETVAEWTITLCSSKSNPYNIRGFSKKTNFNGSKSRTKSKSEANKLAVDWVRNFVHKDASINEFWPTTLIDYNAKKIYTESIVVYHDVFSRWSDCNKCVELVMKQDHQVIALKVHNFIMTQFKKDNSIQTGDECVIL